MMLRKKSMGIGDAYYCGTDPLSVADATLFGVWNYSNCPTAYCAVNPTDALCATASAPTGIAPGTPVGYNGSTAPSNTTGAVTTPTQQQQQQALSTAITQVIANDPNVASNLGGSGTAADPNAACPLWCTSLGIGCPTACDPNKVDIGSSLMVGAAVLAVIFVAIEAIK